MPVDKDDLMRVEPDAATTDAKVKARIEAIERAVKKYESWEDRRGIAGDTLYNTIEKSLWRTLKSEMTESRAI
jgi:hypothetical protein